jgi:hypothetical protein
MRKYSLLILFAVIASMQGCAVGYNSTLFMSKSNIGIDADTKPPTLEISIARREGVIAPALEGGQTPPVLASFRTDSNPFSRFFFGIKSTFAGGDAAVALTNVSGDSKTAIDSAACLSKPPDKQTVLGFDVSVPEPGAVKPFVFGTDTTFGLKVAWSGTTGEIPDTVRLGFHRKEFAWAPLFGTTVTNCNIPGGDKKGTYAVWMPPFLAVLDNDVQTGSLAQTKVTWLQYFATGKSATLLASQNEVRRVMMERMDPVTYKTGTYDTGDPAVTCVESWLNTKPDNSKELQTWWQSKGLPGIGTLLISSKEFKDARAEFLKDKKIICN